MFRDVSSCNTYNYGDALYWDARYIQEGGSFDWYQRYSALRPFVRNFIPFSSRILMVGCGNAGNAFPFLFLRFALAPSPSFRFNSSFLLCCNSTNSTFTLGFFSFENCNLWILFSQLKIYFPLL